MEDNKPSESRSKVVVSKQYDVVLLGCGFYGKLVLQRLLELFPEEQYRIGIAGRNAAELRSAVAGMGVSEDRVGVIAPVDACSYVAMRALAGEARVILACLPNYRAVGDAVVRACAEEGTHYFDLSVETDLHSEWRELYGNMALSNGCVIAPSCGFDYVVAEFGAVELARMLPPPYAMHTVECHMSVKTGPMGVVLREGTFYDLLDRLGHPSPIPRVPRRAHHGHSAGGGGRALWRGLLHRLLAAIPLQYSGHLGSWSLPGPQSEVEVVELSQGLIHDETHQENPPPCFVSRMSVSSLSTAFLFMLGMVFIMLAKLAAVRWVLRRVAPPLLLRLGVLTRDESRYRQAMEGMSIKKVFVGRGVAIRDRGTPGGGADPVADIEKQLTIVARGSAITPNALALAAHTVLTEWDRVAVEGVTTPAAAFHNTGFWARVIKWSKLEVVGGGGEGVQAHAKEE